MGNCLYVSNPSTAGSTDVNPRHAAAAHEDQGCKPPLQFLQSGVEWEQGPRQITHTTPLGAEGFQRGRRELTP